MDDDRHRRRAWFDEEPERFDRVRPVCPAELFDDLVSLAGLQRGARVVEIGCGTGQATVPLCERGLEVTAVELGAGLADLARRNVARFPGTSVVTSSFEAWRPPHTEFDAVVAVNAFHWIDEDVALPKCASLVSGRGGSLVIVGTPWVQPDDGDPFFDEVQEDYAVLDGEHGTPPPRPDKVKGHASLVERSGLFDLAASRRYLMRLEYSADDWVALLSTQNWVSTVDAARVDDFLARVHARIERRGGVVRPAALATLDVARYSPGEPSRFR